MAVQAGPFDQLNAFATQKLAQFEELKKANDAFDIGFTTLASAAQGCFIGALAGGPTARPSPGARAPWAGR